MCKPRIRYFVDIRRVGSKYEIVGVDPQLADFPVGSKYTSWDALAKAIQKYEQSKEMGSRIGFSATLPAEGDVRDETYREWLRAAGLEFVPEPNLEKQLGRRQEVWKGVFRSSKTIPNSLRRTRAPGTRSGPRRLPRVRAVAADEQAV